MSVAERASSQPPLADPATGYLSRLTARVERVGNCLCLGIDPDPASLPSGFSANVAGIESFSRLLIEAASPHAAAVKANLAFFEAFGSAGVAALDRLRALVPADIPFIADAKRGDIGSTAARQAVALFDVLGADAVTASPYLGRDAIEPLTAGADRFVYVLCRTSNPGAAELQGLALADGQPLYLHVARQVAEWQAAGAPLGLVVGATAPAELRDVRAAAPGLPFLVPGAGAQGGDVDAVLTHGPATAAAAGGGRGGGLLVNVSRGIASAAADTPDTPNATDAGAAISAAAEAWARTLQC